MHVASEYTGSYHVKACTYRILLSNNLLRIVIGLSFMHPMHITGETMDNIYSTRTVLNSYRGVR